MSWIVKEYLRELPYIKERADINSDAYNNVIIIEKVIEDMQKQGLLSPLEETVLWHVIYGYSYSEISEICELHRLTISKIVTNITNRIAYILGGEFTNSSLVDKIYAYDNIHDKSIQEIFSKRPLKAKEILDD